MIQIEIDGDWDEVIDERAAILVCFEYPLARPVVFEFFNPVGRWTRGQIIDAISNKYLEIYTEEAETTSVPEGVEPGLFNRNRTSGKFGIWGHEIEDLVLCGFRRGPDGIYELSIES